MTKVRAKSSTERNKTVVLRFFKEAEQNGIGTAMEFLAEDATWWVLGAPPLGGTYSKPEMTRLQLKVAESIEGGWKFHIHTVTAEGDRVAVESETEAKLVNGTTYRGNYHWLFFVKAGKIRKIREYLDTLYVHEIYVKAFLGE